MSSIKDLMALSFDKRSLRMFGVTMGIAFCVIGLLIALKHRHWYALPFFLGLVFFLLAFFAPAVLRPIYRCWMRLAYILSWINTRILLCVLFYVVITPMSIIIKLFRVDLLDRRINKSAETYWKDKERKTFAQADFERQF